MKWFTIFVVVCSLSISCSPFKKKKDKGGGTPPASSSGDTGDTDDSSGLADCDGTASGDTESRTRYETETVATGGTCSSESQTRTCTDGTWGSWSGTYTFTSCRALNDCDGTNSGDTDSRTRYETETVATGATCSSETQIRTCTDGTWGSWSGTYTFTSCRALNDCDGTNSGDSETRVRFETQSETGGGSCTSETQSRTCTDGSWGSWSGTYTYTLCLDKKASTSNIEGTSSNNEGDLIVYNSKLVFLGKNSNSKYKLYLYDDSDGSVTQITNTMGDNADDIAGSGGLYYAIYSDKLYFKLKNSSGYEKLYSYDDNAASNKLTEVSNTSGSATIADYPEYMTVIDSKLYFIARDSASDTYLYMYDGSSVTKVSTYKSPGGDLVYYNSKIFFKCDNSNGWSKICRYNPSTTGTDLVTNIRGDNANDNPSYLTVYNNKLYFSASYLGEGWDKVFSYDDSDLSVTRVSNTIGNTSDDDACEKLTVYSDKLYFIAKNSSGRVKLYAFDSSDSSVTQIGNTTGDANVSDSSNYLTVYDSKLFFTSKTSETVYKLFYYDGSSVTQVNVNASGTNDGVQIFPEYSYDSKLIFKARNSNSYEKLYSFDTSSSTVTQISNTAGDSAHDIPYEPTVYNNKLFFTALSSSVRDLYRYASSSAL